MRRWTKPALLALTAVTLAAMALAAGPALARAAPRPGEETAPLPSAWMGDSRTGCKLWNPQPQPGESVRWSGACEGGFAVGPGVTEWFEGGQPTEIVEGARVAGHLQGKGVQTTADGARFEGSWKDDRRNGPGVYTAPDGRRVTGFWVNDELVGRGDPL